jgi:hypothetical protein
MKAVVVAALASIAWSCAACSGDTTNEVETCPVCQEASFICSGSLQTESADLVITSRQESGCTAILNRQTACEIRCAEQVICLVGDCVPFTFVGDELSFTRESVISCSALD